MKFFAAFVALIAVATANPLNTWSLADLTEAVNNPNTNPALLPYLQFALKELQNFMASGLPVDSIVVPTPAVIDAETVPSSWTIQELSDALQNPQTNPAYVPILEEALDHLMNALFTGQSVNAIVINLPVKDVEIIPVPIIPEPEVPEPEVPEKPILLPELVHDPVSSPLVQVIVNVNGQQQQIAEVPQEIQPTPVQIVDEIPDDVAAGLRH